MVSFFFLVPIFRNSGKKEESRLIIARVHVFFEREREREREETRECLGEKDLTVKFEASGSARSVLYLKR